MNAQERKAFNEQSRRDKAKMYRLAQHINTQEQLNLCLMAMRNPRNRGVFYELLKPCIKKFTPHFPDLVRNYDPDKTMQPVESVN